MPVSYRLVLLMLPLLLSFGNFVVVVVGQSPVYPAVSVNGNTPPPSVRPSDAVPISDPSPPPPVVQSQPISFFPTPTRLTLLPPTNSLSTSTNPPSEAAAATALTSIPIPTVARSTPPISTLPVSPLMVPTSSSAVPPASETTLPSTVPRGSPPPSSQTTLPTRAATTIPVNTAPSSIPQRCQLTFDNKLDNVKVTDYDLWTQRSDATNQLAALCEIPADRITNLGIEANASGNLVLRFTIAQGWPVYSAEALQNLKYKLNASTPALKLAGLPLISPVAIFWTDNGPCPTDVCLNNGICDVTLFGNYTCSCDVSHTGPRCQDDAQPVQAAGGGGRDLRLLALLVLLAIPIAVAVIVGFHFGRRRQEKEQLRRAFDLRDVRTMGPKSMLSLPMESGIRNDMYDTRSFALAFTDTTFSKAGSGSLTPPASSSSTNTTTSTTSSITKDDNDNGGDGLF